MMLSLASYIWLGLSEALPERRSAAMDCLLIVLFVASVICGLYVVLRIRIQRIRSRRLAERIIEENQLYNVAVFLAELATRDPQVRAVLLQELGVESDSSSDSNDPLHQQ